MKIIVCIKQVPDTKGGVKFNPDGTLDRAAMLAIMNPDDKAGLEAALRLKDQYGAEVTVLTMGLPKAADALREALAMGADKAVLVTDRVLGGADTWATSTTLAGALRGMEYDLIIAGRQAIDGDTAQVGPQIAEKLHLPQVTYAGEVKKDGNELTIMRMLEDGYMTVKVHTPCMITCIKELNDPRYMNFRGTIECWDKPLTIMDYNALKDHELIDASTIGLKGSPTNIYKSFAPPVKEPGMILEGSGKETTDKLAHILTGKHII